jgi:Tol biopolymer transport system component
MVDVFVHDRQTGVTKRVSVAFDGTQGNGLSWMPSISGDGRFVAFASDASNLVPGDTNGWPDVFVTCNPLAQQKKDIHWYFDRRVVRPDLDWESNELLSIDRRYR